MLTSQHSQVKYLCIHIIEKLLSSYKFSFISSTNEIYSYIASLLQPKSNHLKETENSELFHSHTSHEDANQENESPNSLLKRSYHRNSTFGSPLSSRRGSFSSVQAKHEDQMYHIILELLLGRCIESSNILDDTDYIHSILGLYLMQIVVSKSLPEVQHKALQDQLMLTKWNKNNCNVLITNQDWHFWLLDLLYQTSDNVEAADAIIDIGIRLHTTVFLQGMEHSDAIPYIRRLTV